MVARHHKLSLFYERKVFDDPPACLSLSELKPLVWVEESIVIWQVQVLADKSQYLRFSSKGIIAYDDRRSSVLIFHLRVLSQDKILLCFCDATCRARKKEMDGLKNRRQKLLSSCCPIQDFRIISVFVGLTYL